MVFIRKRNVAYLIVLFCLFFIVFNFHNEQRSILIDSHPYENQCKFPVLEDEDESMESSIKHEGASTCSFIYKYQVVSRSMDGIFIINSSSFPYNMSCYLQIITGTLFPNVKEMNYSESVQLPRDQYFIVNEDTFIITCKSETNHDNVTKGEEIFKRPYMGVKLKEDERLIIGWRVFEHIQCRYIIEVSKNNIDMDMKRRKFDVNSMSISIIGFDSTSRSQFARHMKKSKVLMDTMGFITLFGYNKVGDNSIPNLGPILAAPYKESEDYDILDKIGDINLAKLLPYAKKIDPDTIPFLWKKMQKKGCEVIFNDDIGHTSRGLFHYTAKYFKPGFSFKPTEHYYRPYYNHLHKFLNNKWKMCLDGQNLLEEFMNPWYFGLKNLADRCYFSFSFLTSQTHDNPNNLEAFDESFSKRLMDLMHTADLSNTMLIVLGDHGQRMHGSQVTFAGRIEERQPLMSIRLPEQFIIQYPNEYANLITNAHRLTSNVDIHETLKDIIENRLGKNREKGRGQSLFTSISSTRTCKDAFIPINFCLCQFNATTEDINSVGYKHERTELIMKIRSHILLYGCIDPDTLNCHEDYQLLHPHKSVRMGFRDKINWTSRLNQEFKPKGFTVEMECEVGTFQGSLINILIRSRVSEKGNVLSIPYPPMIISNEGTCKDFKNLDSLCKCELDELFRK